MQFSFPISKALDFQQDGFVLVTREYSSHLTKTEPSSQSPHSSSQPKFSHKENLGEIIDILGKQSCQARGLKHPLTSYTRLMSQNSSRIYIKGDAQNVYGFITLETKKLPYIDLKGVSKEDRFICITDFYVHESVQRNGIGKAIFEKMLKSEKTKPSKLAKHSIDFLAFLKKYYGLKDYLHQPKHFIIFKSYWEQNAEQSNSPQIVSNKDLGQIERFPQLEGKSYRDIGSFNDELSSIAQQEDGTKKSLIELLLKSPSVLENKIFTKIRGDPEEVTGVSLFENDNAKALYAEIYKWHSTLERQLREKEEYLKMKKIIKVQKEETK